jgi:hypothetical protein
MSDSAINHRTSRPVLDGTALDRAIDEARAELAALLRVPGGGEPSRLTGARRCRTPCRRNETGDPLRQNALDPGFHRVPPGPAHPDRDADGADVS